MVVVIYKKIIDLKPHPKNDFYFDMEDTTLSFELLKNSISESGLEEPVKITENNIIISGHRRFKALKELGHEQIPCSVYKFNKKNLNEDDIEIALIESNLTQRGATNIKNKVKLGRCIDKICEYYGLQDGNNQYTTQERVGNNFASTNFKYTTKKQLADEFGVSTRQLSNYQSLAHATDELQNAIMENKITSTKGIQLSKLSEQVQKEIVEQLNATGKLPVEENMPINLASEKDTKSQTSSITPSIKEETPLLKPKTYKATSLMNSIKKEWEDKKEQGTEVILSDFFDYCEKEYSNELKIYNEREDKSFYTKPVRIQSELECIDEELDGNEWFNKSQLSWLVELQEEVKATIDKMFSSSETINTKVFENITETIDRVKVDLEEAVSELEWYVRHFDNITQLLDEYIHREEDDDEYEE